jgi:hypothetical protein
MLEELGCKVMTAGNAIDALTMLGADHGIEMFLKSDLVRVIGETTDPKA